ncbi:MAG: hypothetical protein U0441_11090 [Polyangiaceae bacterium]
MRNCTLIAASLVLLTPACAYRPARFADARPVTEIADDDGIDMPQRLEVNDVVEFSDLFVGRPLVEAMRITRRPPPGDVNALDEVPRSSWFAPLDADVSSFEGVYAVDGPPVPPFRVILERAPSGDNGDLKRGGMGIPVVDALGHRFELRRDPRDRVEVRTAAAAITARLVRALGYYAPEVYISDAEETDFSTEPGEPFAQSILSGNEPSSADARRQALYKMLQDWLDSAPPSKTGNYRFSATRWPPAADIDVGRTPVTGTRGDDPNDRVDHESRRTLRALRLVGAWLGMTRFTPHDLRDVYTGQSGDGHLVHYMVGFDKSLGTEAIIGKRPQQTDEMKLLGTLGFAPDPNIPPTQRKYEAIGAIGEEVDPLRYGPGLPFPAMDATDGADAYWMAKRIAAIGEEMVLHAVRSGKVTNRTARKLLFELILARQRRVVEWGYAQTTPCDYERLDDHGIVVYDRAVAGGFTTFNTVEYVVSYIDADGETTHPGAVLGPDGPRFAVPLPKAAFGADGYLVVRLRSEVSGVPAPREMEIHLIRDVKGTRVVGVKH